MLGKMSEVIVRFEKVWLHSSYLVLIANKNVYGLCDWVYRCCYMFYLIAFNEKATVRVLIPCFIL